jgi:hypothetical protein
MSKTKPTKQGVKSGVRKGYAVPVSYIHLPGNILSVLEERKLIIRDTLYLLKMGAVNHS